MLHIGGRLYLATDQLVLPIQRHNDTIRLPISPLHIYQFSCDYSFHSQSTGLANCPRKLTFNFLCFIVVNFILSLGKQSRNTMTLCCQHVSF